MWPYDVTCDNKNLKKSANKKKSHKQSTYKWKVLNGGENIMVILRYRLCNLVHKKDIVLGEFFSTTKV